MFTFMVNCYSSRSSFGVETNPDHKVLTISARSGSEMAKPGLIVSNPVNI